MSLLYFCHSHGTMPLPVISERNRFLCPHCRDPLVQSTPDFSLPRSVDRPRAATLPAADAGLLSRPVAAAPVPATARGAVDGTSPWPPAPLPIEQVIP